MTAQEGPVTAKNGLLQSGLIAPLLYLLLLVFWNIAIYSLLAYFETSHWPLCWDFIHFYQCGAMTLSPDRLLVYDPAAQLDWTNKLISPAHVDELWFVQYVPFVFPLMMPFALLPLKTSYLVFCLVSTAVGLLPLVLILKKRAWTALAVFGMALAALACYPGWQSIWWGQLAWFYLCLIGFYFISLKKKSDTSSGILLALLSVKPQYIFYLAVPAFASGRLKIIAWAACTEILLLLLAGFSIGWDNVIHYPQTLLFAEKQGGQMQVNAANMVSIRGPLSLILPHTAVLGLSFTLNLAVLPLIWVTWRRAFSDPNSNMMNLAMAITLPAALVLSAHSHAYDCLFLLLSAALILPGFRLQAVFDPASSGIQLRKQDGISAIAYRFLMGSLYFYPIISWILFLTLNRTEDNLYPRAFALLDTLILVAGLLVFFATGKAQIENTEVSADLQAS